MRETFQPDRRDSRWPSLQASQACVYLITGTLSQYIKVIVSASVSLSESSIFREILHLSSGESFFRLTVVSAT